MIKYLKDIAAEMKANPTKIEALVKQYELTDAHKKELEDLYEISFPKKKQSKTSTAPSTED